MDPVSAESTDEKQARPHRPITPKGCLSSGIMWADETLEKWLADPEK